MDESAESQRANRLSNISEKSFIILDGSLENLNCDLQTGLVRSKFRMFEDYENSDTGTEKSAILNEEELILLREKHKKARNIRRTISASCNIFLYRSNSTKIENRFSEEIKRRSLEHLDRIKAKEEINETAKKKTTAARKIKKFIKSSLRNSFRLKRSKSFEPKTAEVKEKLSRTKSALTYMYPPAPLVVEDPPSSEDGQTDLEDVKSPPDPALLNGSSGNFGSAGARSAPSTPQGLVVTSGGLQEPHSQPCTPGCTSPLIQRSPSHSVFTKCDRTSLKHLSTSTPVMTAQSQIAEPSSPKVAKVKQPHKTSHQKKFDRHFPHVEKDERVLNHYSCALIGDILLQGHLYITANYFAFYSNVFGYVTKLLIPLLTVEELTKEKTARIIPNAIGVSTGEDKHVFGSLMSRDSTLDFMKKIWQAAKDANPPPEPPPIEPDVDVDSTETGEGESGRESPVQIVQRKIEKDVVDGVEVHRKKSSGLQSSLKGAISEFRKLPRQNIILFATTFLLILLFLSASLLLYRISKIQSRYALALQDNKIVTSNNDIYGDLLNWQMHLHSKSAGAVNSFLDTNLDQIAKVRQSLEALSTLLVSSDSDSIKPSEAKDTS